MSYLVHRSTSELDHRVQEILIDLRPFESKFKTIVVRGLSGIVPGAIVAHTMGKNLCVIRKPNETTHGYRVEGEFKKPYIILDDFVVTGATIAAIMDTVLEHKTSDLPIFVMLHGPSGNEKHRWSQPEWKLVPVKNSNTRFYLKRLDV